MKILHVLDHSLPLHSGYTFRSQNIFRCQREAGLEPLVVTSPKHEASWKGDWAAEELIDGVRYYRTGASSGTGLPFFAERSLMKRLEKRLQAVAERERPHALHAHSPVLNAIPALRVGKRLGIPVIYEIRAFWEDAAADLNTYAEGSLKYRLVRTMETRACRRANTVVTICEGLKTDLLGRGLPAEKITVVPNAVDPDEFSAAEPDQELARQWDLTGKVVVGFLGSFYHYEGLDLLLEAAAKLREDLPSLRILLVGGGPMEGSLKAICERLGLNGRVVFAGRLPHEKMPGVYGLVDILAYPRKPMRLTELVTPLKPLEAMAMGKAQVASDVGGHKELIRDGETGVLFQAGSVEALSEAIRGLAADGDFRRRLGETGRAWVLRERSWRQNSERYRRLCEAVRTPSLDG